MNGKHYRLFIPGPTEVRPEVLQAMATPQIGHRHPEFQELYKSIQPKLKKLLYTEGDVYIFTSSSTGAMEAAVRNCTKKKVLSCINGAFSKRWNDIAKSNNIDSGKLEVEWGKAIKPEMVDKELATGEYDNVTIVLNETSTGVMNPVEEISKMINEKYPDVTICVDAVSGMAGVPIKVDEWGLDVCLAGVQKCFSMPTGIAICSVSERALAKAKEIEHRGFYFDFLMMKKYHDKNQTPSTPSISHLYALDVQLTFIVEQEGLDKRFARHAAMAEIVRDWAKKHFELYAEEGYESQTLTTIKNTKEINVAELNKKLKEKTLAVISNGYGAIKEKTFRIAHMADTQEYEIRGILETIEDVLGL